jgi:hypothetical protein
MYLFQFGLQTDPQPVQATVQNDLYIATLILWVFVFIGLAFAGLYVLRFFLRRMSAAREATFNRTVLLVSMPKFRHKEESERSGTKDQVMEAIAAAETFFSSIGGLKAERGLKAWLIGRNDEFSFEIVAQHKVIKFYVTCPTAMRDFVEQALSAAWPDAYTEEVEDYNIFQPSGVILGSHLVFKRQHAFPFKTYRELEKDPLNAITNVLSKIPEEDGAVFQFLIRSSYAKWRKKGISIARNMQQGMRLEEAIKGKKKGQGSWAEIAGIGGKSEEQQREYKLSPREEQIVKGLEEKASKAGMDVCVRLIASSANATSAQTMLSNMLNSFAQYNIYEYGNSFVKVVPRRKKKIVQDFIYRSFNERNTIVCNTEEMASLWHMPLPWTETPNIHWLGARKAPAPAGIPTNDQEGDLKLGFNMYRGIKTPVYMKTPDRSRHMYIMGKSGSGKSQTMVKYILQDIAAGHGVAVVEPHGDLVEQVLANMPKDRIDDVIVFDPSDLERPLGINLLEVPNENMRDFAVQEMISVFYKLFPPEMIGPMFEHNMRNFMLTLMADIKNPGTIAEIPRMVTDDAFQKQWRAKLTDPVVKSFWEDEMDSTSDYHKSEMMGYLVSKVGRFVENEMMRNIIGQSKSSFDFREVMDKKKILLVNLSKGKTGDVNAELLGLVIVSKLQMAALTRADIPEDQRHDFFLYIDEFQNFITDSIAVILSEARKYRLNLVIAHQYVGQLIKNNDTTIKDAVFGNVGTMYVARIGPEDVEVFEKIYGPTFGGYDLINSDKYTWYVKMIVDNSQMKPFTMNLVPAGKGDPELASAIKELSRLKYGRDKSIVEAEIAERTQIGASKPSTPPPPAAPVA